MKSIKYLITILGLFIFIGSVDAAGVSINIDCPSSVEPNSNFNCKVYANATGSSVSSYSWGDLTGQGSIAVIRYDEIRVSSIPTGSNVDLGTIRAKAGSAGTGSISVPFYATFADSSKQNFTALKNIKIVSSVNTLNSLTVNGTNVTGFNKNVTNYNVNTSSSSINIGATKTNSKASVSGIGQKSLNCGDNNLAVTVKAESGSTKVYNLKVNRKCSNNSKLRGITLSSGVLSPVFSDSVTDYTVKVDKSVEKISISGVKSVNTQNIAGEVKDKELSFGKTNFILNVTSETGEKTNYNITVERADTRDKSVMLSALSLSSGRIKFDPETFEYETKVLYEIDKIDVVATPQNETSKVEAEGNTNLKVGENIIKVKVKSENNIEGIYTIKVTRLKEGETIGDNAKIKNIVIKGYKLNFDYDKNKYKLVIKRDKKLNIIVVMDDKDATYEIIGNKDLKDGSKIQIVTKSVDGTESETYVIDITKTNYTGYYILGLFLLALLIAVPLLVYFKYVKPKKQLKDINGNQVGMLEDDKERTIIDSSIPKTESTNTTGLTGIKCPVCGRELLGMPSECPYCKTGLKYNMKNQDGTNR